MTDQISGRGAVAEIRAATPESVGAMMQELQRISQTREDWVVPSTRLHMEDDGPLSIRASIGGETAFAGIEVPTSYAVTKTASEQIAEKMGIPWKYYQRMRDEAPGLLAENVNHWMEQADSNYLVRTLDGRARAFLSQRYRTMDDYDFAFQVIDVCRDVGAQIIGAALSEERLYIRAIMRDWGQPIIGRNGDGTDIVIPGILASNSSVGKGGLNIEAYAIRVLCMNGSCHVKGFHRVHLGEKRETGLQLAADTQRAQDEALWLEVRDMVRATFDRTIFEEWIAGMNTAATQVLAEPTKAIDVVCKNVGLTDEHRESLLSYLMAPQDPLTEGGTVWGMVNGINRLAHGLGADEEARLERAAGEVLATADKLFVLR